MFAVLQNDLVAVNHKIPSVLVLAKKRLSKPVRAEIGARLRKARLAAGFKSQDLVINELNKKGLEDVPSQQSLSGYESGATEVPLLILISLVQIYSVSYDEILSGGKGGATAEPRAAPAGRACIDLPAHANRPLEAAEKRLLEKTLTVLRSPGATGNPDRALVQNIEAFHGAVEMHRRLMVGAQSANGPTGGEADTADKASDQSNVA